jgi:hypothetical protein
MPLASTVAFIGSPQTRTVLSRFDYDCRRHATGEPMARVCNSYASQS